MSDAYAFDRQNASHQVVGVVVVVVIVVVDVIDSIIRSQRVHIYCDVCVGISGQKYNAHIHIDGGKSPTINLIAIVASTRKRKSTIQ